MPAQVATTVVWYAHENDLGITHTDVPMTTAHIGIVACSAPGAALCYETICVEANHVMGRHHNPEVSLHMVDLADHVRCMEQDDWDGVAKLILTSVQKLATIGATFAICPDNTAHIAIEKIVAQSPLPWLHIADAVAAEAKIRGYRRLGLLGTRYLVESAVYPNILQTAAIEWRLPDPADRERINQIIFDELVFAKVTAKAQADFIHIIEDFRSRKECDAVILGCTEIPLAVSTETSPLPVLDSTRLLARAALKRSVEGFARNTHGTDH
jgi:aspartate racemase